MSKILGLTIDDKILQMAIDNNLIIFGLESGKYKEIEELIKDIELTLGRQIDEDISEVLREPELPTHNDMNKMLLDMYEYYKQYPDLECIPADNPIDLLVGYVVYRIKNDREDAVRRFSIHLKDVRHDPLKYLVDTAKDRSKLGTKKSLEKMFGKI